MADRPVWDDMRQAWMMPPGYPPKPDEGQPVREDTDPKGPGPQPVEQPDKPGPQQLARMGLTQAEYDAGDHLYPQPQDMHTLEDRLAMQDLPMRAFRAGAHDDVAKGFAQQAGVTWGAMQDRDPGDEDAAWEREMEEAIDAALAQRPKPSEAPLTNPNGDQALKGRADGYREGWAEGYRDGWEHVQRLLQSSMSRAASRGFRPFHHIRQDNEA